MQSFVVRTFFTLVISGSIVLASYPAPAQALSFADIGSFFWGSSSKASTQVGSVPVSPSLLESHTSVPLSEDEEEASDNHDDGLSLSVTQGNALIATRNPNGVFDDGIHDEIVVYTVKSGDSPTGIAKRFGITLNTLLWANDLRNSGSIKVGDQLVILPVSGIQYHIKKNDTIESIARRFKPKDETDISLVVADIMVFNGLAINEQLEVGSMIIIPDGEIVLSPAPSSPKPTGSLSRSMGLPEYIGYFLRPIIGGRNVRATKNNPHGLHGYNGVDLANGFGTSVMASAEGTVIRAKSTGWNGGYGKHIIITHPNGTQTLYAHLNSILVEVGQRIVQGASIGYLGSTGNSTGPHVHFEIRGAKNPF
ncbi:MAG: peptidoglycan DD-metalloendopeptidase family protein [bacterium]|nr:peptidoglycan DD-metalloendopeptidase family protein [bacterium]